jgi:hypothetical protein
MFLGASAHRQASISARSRNHSYFPSPLVGEGGSHRRCETGEGALSQWLWHPSSALAEPVIGRAFARPVGSGTFSHSKSDLSDFDNEMTNSGKPELVGRRERKALDGNLVICSSRVGPTRKIRPRRGWKIRPPPGRAARANPRFGSAWPQKSGPAPFGGSGARCRRWSRFAGQSQIDVVDAEHRRSCRATPGDNRSGKFCSVQSVSPGVTAHGIAPGQNPVAKRDDADAFPELGSEPRRIAAVPHHYAT